MQSMHYYSVGYKMKKYLFIDNNQSDIKANAIGSGNKNFHIYKNPTGMVEAIKNGWSWPGFFNSSLWLIYKGMFILALQVFVFFAMFVFLLFEHSFNENRPFPGPAPPGRDFWIRPPPQKPIEILLKSI